MSVYFLFHYKLYTKSVNKDDDAAAADDDDDEFLFIYLFIMTIVHVVHNN